MLPSTIAVKILGVVALIAPITLRAQEGNKAAEVNGAPILAAEVDAKLGNNLAQLQQQIYNLRQQQLDSMIDQKLLEDEAAKQGVTISALVQAEITSHVPQATSEDAAKFFKDNSEKLKGDLPSLEGQIKAFLTAQRMQVRQREYLQSLRSAAKVSIFLPRPPIYRSVVATEGAPFRGGASAPVTIAEFSDFHCPFCRKVQPVLDDLRAKYGAKIKIVYRDFPLDNLHPHAREAAEASHCAIEQGRFWEFHDLLFKNDPDSSRDALDRFAKEVGIDVAAFEACRSSGKYAASVKASAQEGTQLGITGTPTFFVNGRILVGAQPADAFIRIIDEEIAAAAAPVGEQRIAYPPSSLKAEQPQGGAPDTVLGVIAPAGLTAKMGGVTEARLRLEIKPGFHVNSNTPSDEYLIPLKLTWNPGPLESTEVVFPAPQFERFSFSQQPIPVFAGAFDVITRFRTAPGH